MSQNKLQYPNMCFLNPYGFRCVVQLFPLFSHPKIRKNAMKVLKGTSFPRNSFLVGKSSVKSLPIAEADEMNVTLSVESSLGDLLQRLIDHHACFLAAMGAPGWVYYRAGKDGNRLDKSSIPGEITGGNCRETMDFPMKYRGVSVIQRAWPVTHLTLEIAVEDCSRSELGINHMIS